MENMEAKELRIGNYVQFKDSKEVQSIYELEHRYKTVYRINDLNNNEDLEPIPLTEEWMLSFGASYKPCGISGADMWQGMGFWTYKDKAGMPITFRGSKNCKGGLTLYPYFNTNFDTVHGFQNIIKDLTKNDITIKE